MFLFFFFNDTATTEIYTLSLHDALPIYSEFFSRHLARAGGCEAEERGSDCVARIAVVLPGARRGVTQILKKQRDRKSTRLNSSHSQISYAVFCLKKKKKRNCHALISAQR